MLTTRAYSLMHGTKKMSCLKARTLSLRIVTGHRTEKYRKSENIYLVHFFKSNYFKQVTELLEWAPRKASFVMDSIFLQTMFHSVSL